MIPYSELYPFKIDECWYAKRWSEYAPGKPTTWVERLLEREPDRVHKLVALLLRPFIERNKLHREVVVVSDIKSRLHASDASVRCIKP